MQCGAKTEWSSATACPLLIFTVPLPEAKKDSRYRNKHHATVIFRVLQDLCISGFNEYPWDTLSFFYLLHLNLLHKTFISAEPPAPNPHPIETSFDPRAATSKRRLLRRLQRLLAQRVRQLQGLLPGWCDGMPCSGVQLQLGTCHSFTAQKQAEN